MAAHDGGFIALERARGCFLPCSQRTLLGRRWLVIDAGPRQRWWVSRPHAAEPLPPPWPTRGMLLVESLPRVWPQPHWHRSCVPQVRCPCMRPAGTVWAHAGRRCECSGVEAGGRQRLRKRARPTLLPPARRGPHDCLQRARGGRHRLSWWMAGQQRAMASWGSGCASMARPAGRLVDRQ
jgi:hypothetical protein